MFYRLTMQTEKEKNTPKHTTTRKALAVNYVSFFFYNSNSARIFLSSSLLLLLHLVVQTTAI